MPSRPYICSYVCIFFSGVFYLYIKNQGNKAYTVEAFNVFDVYVSQVGSQCSCDCPSKLSSIIGSCLKFPLCFNFAHFSHSGILSSIYIRYGMYIPGWLLASLSCSVSKNVNHFINMICHILVKAWF